jgi:hypothetical protein
MSLTDFKAKMNKSKINKYKINNNNKTNTKHKFNVKYNIKDINKILAKIESYVWETNCNI